MSVAKPWRFSESRPIRPFRIAEHALDGVGFKVRDDSLFSSESPWSLILEPEEIIHQSFRPALELNVDPDSVAEQAGLPLEHLILSVVVRDPALLKSELIGSWPLSGRPVTFEVTRETLDAFSGSRGLQFVVQVSLSKNLASAFRTASRVGQIVAAREFVVSVPQDGADFPIDLVDSSAFEKYGWPPETVWAIRWLSESDFDRPVEEVLVVLINKDHGEKLLRLSGQDTAAAVIWREIATEVFVEICMAVFGNDPPKPEDKDSLLGKIYARLNKVTGADFDTLVRTAKEPLRGMSFFRSNIQKALELAGYVQRITLAGRA